MGSLLSSLSPFESFTSSRQATKEGRSLRAPSTSAWAEDVICQPVYAAIKWRNSGLKPNLDSPVQHLYHSSSHATCPNVPIIHIIARFSIPPSGDNAVKTSSYGRALERNRHAKRPARRRTHRRGQVRGALQALPPKPRALQPRGPDRQDAGRPIGAAPGLQRDHQHRRPRPRGRVRERPGQHRPPPRRHRCAPHPGGDRPPVRQHRHHGRRRGRRAARDARLRPRHAHDVPPRRGRDACQAAAGVERHAGRALPARRGARHRGAGNGGRRPVRPAQDPRAGLPARPARHGDARGEHRVQGGDHHGGRGQPQDHAVRARRTRIAAAPDDRPRRHGGPRRGAPPVHRQQGDQPERHLRADGRQPAGRADGERHRGLGRDRRRHPQRAARDARAAAGLDPARRHGRVRGQRRDGRARLPDDAAPAGDGQRRRHDEDAGGELRSPLWRRLRRQHQRHHHLRGLLRPRLVAGQALRVLALGRRGRGAVGPEAGRGEAGRHPRQPHREVCAGHTPHDADGRRCPLHCCSYILQAKGVV